MERSNKWKMAFGKLKKGTNRFIISILSVRNQKFKVFSSIEKLSKNERFVTQEDIHKKYCIFPLPHWASPHLLWQLSIRSHDRSDQILMRSERWCFYKISQNFTKFLIRRINIIFSETVTFLSFPESIFYLLDRFIHLIFGLGFDLVPFFTSVN